jgi:ribosomal protein S18 acetylase RimI-like enzyme
VRVDRFTALCGAFVGRGFHLDIMTEFALFVNGMNYLIRSITPADQPFLWEMLYQALYVSADQSPPPRDVINQPDLARYVQDWGREGDRGFVAIDDKTRQAMGAVWLRFLIGENQGYGYVDDATPELGIAVLPAYRGHGIGTALLHALVASNPGAISLSVAADNPAVRLYQRFGFAIARESDGTLILKRDESPIVAEEC